MKIKLSGDVRVKEGLYSNVLRGLKYKLIRIRHID